MKIVGVDHFTINVMSLDICIPFYQDTMQLEKMEQVDMGDHIIQYFKLDAHNTLELIQYKYLTSTVRANTDCRGIYRHLAIQVEDLDDAFARISKHPDVMILMQPAYCERLKFKNFLFKDPNGVEIEMLER